MKDYSDDPGSKANGALYREIAYGTFAREFEQAVRTRQFGQVGEPVKTQFGYHLIQVESRTPKQPADFEKLNREYVEAAKTEMGYREPTEAEQNAPEAKSATESKGARKVK